MEILHIEATSDTPKVRLDTVLGTFEISQRCFPEDATEFFSPIIEWIKKYAGNPNDTTHFNFKLEYFNTASSKQLFKIFLLLEELSKKKEVIIFWHYNNEDSDMFSSGDRYSKLVKLNFQMVEY